jgi:CubicO group peptidase (beta-lactamase class C family)
VKLSAFPALFLGLLTLAAAAPAGLPRSTPEAQGVSSADILKFIEGAEAKIDAVHSFILVRHGQIVAEGWWSPYAADKTHKLFSLTKSFTSTAVGLAIAEGKLSLDDQVLKFFPDEAPAKPSEELKTMTVRDLLRMSTGHDKKDVDAAFNRIWPMPEPNLVKKFFAMPIARPPGTGFVYDSVGSHVLSALIQKVTGQTVRDYLRPRLFAPLGIADPEWEMSAQGVPFGGYGLHLHTEDLAKFGQLCLQKGQWHGQQLVPAAWVEAATSKQTDNRKNPGNPESDWEQGYGYQFWMCRHGFYRGDGAVGQFCIVMPQYDAVLAITSGTNDMGSVMQLAWDTIVPAFKDEPLPADPAAVAKLQAKTKGLKLAHDNKLGGF